MKSKILKFVSYQDVPFDREVILKKLDDKTLEKKKRTLSRNRKTVTQESKVQAKDIVTLSAKSKEPKFNQEKMVLTVLGGLCDLDFENTLIGLSLGETKQVVFQDIHVTVTILDIQRQHFPEPNDDEVIAYCKNSFDVKNAKTVSEFFEELQEQTQKRNKEVIIGDTMRQIMDDAILSCEFELQKEDIDARFEYDMKGVHEQARGFGKEFDQMTDEEVHSHIGLSSKQAVIDYLMESAEMEVKMLLWFAKCRGDSILELSVDSERGFEFEFLDSYVRNNLTFMEDLS